MVLEHGKLQKEKSISSTELPQICSLTRNSEQDYNSKLEIGLKVDRGAMPIYTYRCENCGVQFDHTQKFTDDPLKRCPECGKEALRKVYTPVGVVFKGSGFYATDHRSPSGMKFAGSGAEDKAPSSENKTETKTTEKPAAETSKDSKKTD